MALKNRLLSLSLPPIAWPAAIFEKPDGPWIDVMNIMADNARIMVGSRGQHDRSGTLQLLVHHKLGTDYALSQETAGQIAAHFWPDLNMEFLGVRVRVIRAPDVHEGYRSDDGWWVTPIRIRWQSFS
ncbi:phage tail terminator-like protein [Haematobacter sp.]|nr:phage tail terminator-like protein [Haematobacter sp.]